MTQKIINHIDFFFFFVVYSVTVRLEPEPTTHPVEVQRLGQQPSHMASQEKKGRHVKPADPDTAGEPQTEQGRQPKVKLQELCSHRCSISPDSPMVFRAPRSAVSATCPSSSIL